MEDERAESYSLPEGKMAIVGCLRFARATCFKVICTRQEYVIWRGSTLCYTKVREAAHKLQDLSNAESSWRELRICVYVLWPSVSTILHMAEQR